MALKGVKFTEAHKLKISLSNMGKKMSAASKLKMSQSKKRLGLIPPSQKGIGQWRSDVFTRDKFTCQECGLIGVYLEAHHLDKFSDIISRNNINSEELADSCSELWNINNGITLCRKCHDKTKRKPVWKQ